MVGADDGESEGDFKKMEDEGNQKKMRELLALIRSWTEEEPGRRLCSSW